MDSELKLKLELLQKELAKKKLKLKKYEGLKSAKDHVRQKIKEQAELYSLSGDVALGSDTASNAFTLIGPADISPIIAVDEPSLAENPRKCCVSFKLTPIHLSIPGNSVDEEVDCVRDSDLVQSETVNSLVMKGKTFVNSDLLLTGNLDTVNCDYQIASHSQVNNTAAANPITQLFNVALQENYSSKSKSTFNAEEDQARVFLNVLEHSEEIFAPEISDFGLCGENRAGAELQGSQSNGEMPSTDVRCGLNCSVGHNEKILQENDGYQFNKLDGIHSNLQYKIHLDGSLKNNKTAACASETKNKMNEYAMSQMITEPVGNWITNGQDDSLRKLKAYSNPLNEILSYNDKAILVKDHLSKRETSIEENLLVNKVPYKNLSKRLQNPKQRGNFLAEDSEKLYFRSVKAFSTKTGLETQSDSDIYMLQEERDSVTGINVQCSVQSDLMSSDNLAGPDQLLTILPTSASCLGFEQGDICSADLTHCMVSEQAINVNSDSLSASEFSLLDEDTDDLYSRVKARRHRTSAKFSSVDQNRVGRTWTWAADKRKLLAEVDDELMLNCETNSTKNSCEKFVTQKYESHFKQDLENTSVSQSSIGSFSSSARQHSINSEHNVTRQSTLAEYSGDLSALHLCETISNYKHDYLARSSNQFAVQRGDKCANMFLESNLENHSTLINSSENSVGVNSWEASTNCESNNHEGLCGNLVVPTDRKRVKYSSDNSSANQSSFTDNSITDSGTGHSSNLKRVRRSDRLRDKENSEGLFTSREGFPCLRAVDVIKHTLEVIRPIVMDKSQTYEEFSLPEVEYFGCKCVRHRGLDTSEMVKRLSVEQSESTCLNSNCFQLLDNSWNITMQEELWLQSTFESSTITSGSWSLDDFSEIPVIICCHGDGIVMYRKDMDKSEWSLWSTWNADVDQSVISAWPLHHRGIWSLLVISGSIHETCIGVLVFNPSKEQRCLIVNRFATGAGEQIRVCVLTDRAFCIGTLCRDGSDEWEVMMYSLNTDCVTVMPLLALEGRMHHLICMAVVPAESCVCGLSSSEVVIWHFGTGSLLQKISLNLCVSHCPYVFHENGLLFLPCLLSNTNASGCLIVLNPVSTKTFILLEYKSSSNDLSEPCRFTSSGVGDEFLFAVTDNGTLLLWSLFSGALVAKSSGVHVKSATLLKQNTLAVLISNRITTIQLSLNKKQLIDNENLLLLP